MQNFTLNWPPVAEDIVCILELRLVVYARMLGVVTYWIHRLSVEAAVVTATATAAAAAAAAWCVETNVCYLRSAYTSVRRVTDTGVSRLIVYLHVNPTHIDWQCKRVKRQKVCVVSNRKSLA